MDNNWDDFSRMLQGKAPLKATLMLVAGLLLMAWGVILGVVVLVRYVL